MIINDTEALEKARRRKAQDEGREKFFKIAEHEVKDQIHTDRMTNVQERLGHAMFPAELERRLAKLNPNLAFEVIPHNVTHRRISIIDGRGKTPLTVFPNSLIPERSIMSYKEVEAPDPEITHLDRKDMPRHEGELRPGWRKVQIPWREMKRGWRTVLLRLMEEKVLTLTQVENEFGADQTPEWSQHTGKGAFTTPF